MFSLAAINNKCNIASQIRSYNERGDKKNKLKGLLQFDATTWFVLVLMIILIGWVAFGPTQIMGKNSSERSELNSLRDAVMMYQSLRLDGKPPANLEQLISDPSIPAAQAIDGVNHGPLLAPNDRWTSSGSVTDVWGVAYTYTTNSDGTGTITSTGSGKSLSIDF